VQSTMAVPAVLGRGYLPVRFARSFANAATGTLSGPDSHETGQGPHGHLFGTWEGEQPTTSAMVLSNIAGVLTMAMWIYVAEEIWA